MFAALLDTSVLWPSLQRDFLLSLAIEGLYRPLWSTEILAELEYHETQKLINRGEPITAATARASHLIRQMTTAFDDALVENWEPMMVPSVCPIRMTSTYLPLRLWAEQAPSSPST
jgi:hypothetical protein